MRAWGAYQNLYLFCQNFRKGHHTTSLIGSKATLQLVPAALNEGGITRLQVVLFCVGVSKSTGNGKNISISHSCCVQMQLTIIFYCLLLLIVTEGFARHLNLHIFLPAEEFSSALIQRSRNKREHFSLWIPNRYWLSQ